MDANDFITGGIASGIVAILYAVYKICKHSSCSSKCCGRDASINVDLTPPQTPPQLYDAF